MNLIKFLIIALFPALTSATGMAVSLNNVYMYNNTPHSAQIQIKNLADRANLFQIPPRSVCKINTPLLFLPDASESNNFVIMVQIDQNQNSIVIDKFGLLTLAADSAIQARYAGQVKQYSLNGFCGNKLAQTKFLNVQGHDNLQSPPNFVLANCANISNFVYFINTQYVKVQHKIKSINFNQIANCRPPTPHPSAINLMESHPPESNQLEANWITTSHPHAL